MALIEYDHPIEKSAGRRCVNTMRPADQQMEGQMLTTYYLTHYTGYPASYNISNALLCVSTAVS